MLLGTTDGVGTKVMLASAAGRYTSIGHDIVNHCINDLLVQGAFPLFFLDYIASSSLSASRIAEIVGGMAEACADAKCVLLGGETAEMPGVYCPGEFDVAGTMVGAAEKAPPPAARPPTGRPPARPRLVRFAYQWLFAGPKNFPRPAARGDTCGS